MNSREILQAVNDRFWGYVELHTPMRREQFAQAMSQVTGLVTGATPAADEDPLSPRERSGSGEWSKEYLQYLDDYAEQEDEKRSEEEEKRQERSVIISKDRVEKITSDLEDKVVAVRDDMEYHLRAVTMEPARQLEKVVGTVGKGLERMAVAPLQAIRSLFGSSKSPASLPSSQKTPFIPTWPRPRLPTVIPPLPAGQQPPLPTGPRPPLPATIPSLPKALVAR